MHCLQNELSKDIIWFQGIKLGRGKKQRDKKAKVLVVPAPMDSPKE